MTEMKLSVWIGGLKIEVGDLETLDDLVKRYGKIISNESELAANSKADLLQAFCKGQVSASTIVSIFKTRGRGIRIKLGEWAEKVGIWNDSFDMTFKRGVKAGDRKYWLTSESKKKAKEVLNATQ